MSVLLAAAIALSASPRAQASDAATDAAALQRIAVERGLENVSADIANGVPRIAFENRRYRHTADALGRLQRGAGVSHFVATERRLGLAMASIEVSGTGDSTTFRVRYPSDADFAGVPRGAIVEPTSHSVDFLVRPVFAYALGYITAPVQARVAAEPLVRWNPWAGARATASVLLPIYNRFDRDPLHPDVDDVRPGVVTLEQLAWLPRAGLASATVGLFPDNRFGGSAGLARPISGGRFIVDAQADLTGFIAFESGGFTYSTPKQWSAYGGLTWNVPVFDAALRLRAGQFLYGDRGAMLDFRRNFGDFEYQLFVLRSAGSNVQGVRVTLPVPPMTRATQRPVRIQPIERWSISYRTNATPTGEFVGGVTNRDELLRQLSEPGLEANHYRMDRARYGTPAPRDTGIVPWVSSSGMSGFIFTPWAGSLPNRVISLDYTYVPMQWAYSGRGEFNNDAYSLTIGLLPRIEASLRFTRLPGSIGFVPDPDNLIETDTDHMASGRLVLINPRNGRPGLAIGAEDISGTRRFHSTYAVVGMPLEINLMQTRFSLGYAPRVFTATRHVLDGGFGAAEVSPWRAVAARVEYDTEKWNVGLGVVLPFGLRLRVSALNLETLSVGAGWTHGL